MGLLRCNCGRNGLPQTLGTIGTTVLAPPRQLGAIPAYRRIAYFMPVRAT
jgi:hypothetical protein